MLEAHSAMPPLCLARHLGALAEGPCPSARPSVPSALGPSFCFRALRPGPVVREVHASLGYARPMLHVRAYPAGSALTCLVASVALCPVWGLAPFWRLMALSPCVSHTPLLATKLKACRWSLLSSLRGRLRLRAFNGLCFTFVYHAI